MSIEHHKHWKGFKNIKYLIIFGDSYSDVGYRYSRNKPSINNPLGVEFPGITWNEADQPNWVGHLITSLPGGHQLLVYNYAVGGNRVDGVRAQVERQFYDELGNKPDFAPWDASSSLFVTWIGINDCAFIGSETAVTQTLSKLFDIQQQLYNAGARNFLFIDIPPMEKTPAMRNPRPDRPKIWEIWNTHLGEKASGFASEHPDLTVFKFSAHQLFSQVLDNPVQYGFAQGDEKKAYGPIWHDHLHPTSRMHYEIARGFMDFIEAQHSTYNGDHENKTPEYT